MVKRLSILIIGILASLPIPAAYVVRVQQAKRAVLQENFSTLRSAVDSYMHDKRRAPKSIDDLVESGYLKARPLGLISLDGAENNTW